MPVAVEIGPEARVVIAVAVAGENDEQALAAGGNEVPVDPIKAFRP